MGMTIEGLVEELQLSIGLVEQNGKDWFDERDIPWLKETVSVLEKYQKIEDIYYHQSGEALENSLRAVIEDGNVD